MCSTCGARTYGQEQPAERKADVERIKRVAESAKAKRGNS